MINFGNLTRVQTRPKNRVGLDIGSYALKIAEIETGQGGPRLAALGYKRINDHKKETITGAIRDLVAESKISVKDVAISVCGSSVIVRIVSVPKMTTEELKSAIKFEAEKFIPFTINDCIIDFKILRKDDRENKLDVLLVAAKKEYIEERIQMVELGGLAVEVVDVDSFAIMNSFTANFPSADQDKTFALINMGSTLTTLSIVKSGAIFLVRDMPIGSKDVDVALAKSLGIDPAAAEELKLAPKDRGSEITESAKAIFNNLVEETRLPFSYYENQYGRSIDEIYVSGGGAYLVGLEELFQDVFGLKPIIWNPFQFAQTDSPGLNKDLLEKAKCSFAVASGLALR